MVSVHSVDHEGITRGSRGDQEGDQRDWLTARTHWSTFEIQPEAQDTTFQVSASKSTSPGGNAGSLGVILGACSSSHDPLDHELTVSAFTAIGRRPA
jgi:hypothetical protein